MSTYQELALGLTTTTLAVGGQVLPEERVVDVTATVEVQHGCLGSSSLGVVLGIGLGDGLVGGVEPVDVGLVVLGVVELHDLAGNVGLKSTIVVLMAVSSGVQKWTGRGTVSAYRRGREGWPCRGRRWCWPWRA